MKNIPRVGDLRHSGRRAIAGGPLSDNRRTGLGPSPPVDRRHRSANRRALPDSAPRRRSGCQRSKKQLLTIWETALNQERLGGPLRAQRRRIANTFDIPNGWRTEHPCVLATELGRALVA